MAAPVPTYHQNFEAVKAPDAPGLVPPRSLGAGVTEGITLPYRAVYVVIENLDAALPLQWAYTQAGAASGAFNRIVAGVPVSIPEQLAAKRIFIHNPDGAVAVEYQVQVKYTRQPFRADPRHADVTTANGFPAFDASDVLNIQPGI